MCCPALAYGLESGEVFRTAFFSFSNASAGELSILESVIDVRNREEKFGIFVRIDSSIRVSFGLGQ